MGLPARRPDADTSCKRAMTRAPLAIVISAPLAIVESRKRIKVSERGDERELSVMNNETSPVHASPVSQPDVPHLSAPPLDISHHPSLRLSGSVVLFPTSEFNGLRAAFHAAGEMDSDTQRHARSTWKLFFFRSRPRAARMRLPVTVP